jgi:hypothetical protein
VLRAPTPGFQKITPFTITFRTRAGKELVRSGSQRICPSPSSSRNWAVTSCVVAKVASWLELSLPTWRTGSSNPSNRLVRGRRIKECPATSAASTFRHQWPCNLLYEETAQMGTGQILHHTEPPLYASYSTHQFIAVIWTDYLLVPCNMLSIYIG